MPYSAGGRSRDGRLSSVSFSARGGSAVGSVALDCVAVACCLRGSRAALDVQLQADPSRLETSFQHLGSRVPVRFSPILPARGLRLWTCADVRKHAKRRCLRAAGVPAHAPHSFT